MSEEWPLRSILKAWRSSKTTTLPLVGKMFWESVHLLLPMARAVNPTPRDPSGQDSHCPHCDYALEGLPSGHTRCPECGGSLALAAFAAAAVRRGRQSAAARLAMLVSPLVGILAGFAAWLVRLAFVDLLTVLFVCLWLGGAVAVYFAARKERRRLGRAILIGLPVSAVYFVALLCAAVLAVVVLSFIAQRK